MKRILFISPTAGYAGIDVCLESLVMGLDRNKFTPIVVFAKDAVLKKRFEDDGILCYELPLNWWFPVGFHGSSLLDVLPTLRDKVDPLVHIIRDNNIDLVFSNTSVGMDGAFAAAICGVPHMYFLHAQFVPNIYVDMQEETREFLYMLMGKMSDKLVCCSRLLHETIEKYADNSCYIYNGVDVNRFEYEHRKLDPEKPKLNMVCVGHYNQNKQQDFVIRALAHLKKKYSDIASQVFFTMVGPGEKDYCDSLKKMIKKYGLERQVSMESFRNDIHQYLHSFNVYINSSITENLPLSVLEAMASGLPVLGTINDGTIQLVSPQKNGFLCETPEEMAERMVWMLQHPKEFEDMSACSREIAQTQFSTEQYVSNFEKTFDEILSRKNDLGDRARFVNGLYESIVGESITKFPHQKILVVYPRQAMPTYILGVKIPFDILQKNSVIEYKSIDADEFKPEMLDEYDAVLCVRYYHDFAYSLLKMTKKIGKPFFWLIDDNYSGLQLENGNVVHQEKANPDYERMFKESTCTFVYSGGLYHFGAQLTDRIVRLPTIQPDNRMLLQQKSQPHKEVVLGFMGTLKRDHDFVFVIPAIERVIKKYGDRVRFEFIGYYPEKLKDQPNVQHFDFISDYNQFRSFFASRAWDIALAPLQQSLFNASKTNNKYREYSSFHIAGVYSDIEAYSCVQDGVNGLKVNNTSDEWYDAMCRLIDDQILRNQLADCALKDVMKNYAPETGAKEMVRALCRYSNKLGRHQFVATQIFAGSNNKGQYHIPRMYDPNKICFSGNINKPRRYRVYCEKHQISLIGLLFGSEGKVSGSVKVKIYDGKYLLRTVEKNIKELNFNGWNFFAFQTIQGTGCKELDVVIDPIYTSGTMGMFEDREQRTFWYKVFNKLHIPLPGRNTLMVDFVS